MLDVLRSIIQEVSRASDLESVLDIIVERVRTAMNTEVCSIYLRDDAEENVGTGSVGLTSSDLELSHDGATNQIIGMRFNGISIPQGATNFSISARSDRMGIQLLGHSFELPTAGYLDSDPIFPGTVQCPSDGMP